MVKRQLGIKQLIKALIKLKRVGLKMYFILMIKMAKTEYQSSINWLS